LGRGLGPWRRALRETGLALITLGVIVLLFVAYQLWGTGIAEARSQSGLQKQFKAAVITNQAKTPATTLPGRPAPPTTASPVPSVPPGGALDHLVIPAIGVDKYVVEGVGEGDLRKGPGHYPGTVLPGEKGNAAIAGHRTTYGAPFYRVNELTVGDPIYVTDLAGRTFVYKVSQPPVVVSPSDASVLDPTPFAQLTLTTCNPRFSASTRMVIFARLTSRVAQAPSKGGEAGPAPTSPPGPTTTLGGTDDPAVGTTPGQTLALGANLGTGDSGAWPAAVGYGMLLVVMWVGVRIWINRSRRGGRLVAFTLGTALCLIPLWFFFENIVLLLPQSI